LIQDFLKSQVIAAPWLVGAGLAGLSAITAFISVLFVATVSDGIGRLARLFKLMQVRAARKETHLALIGRFSGPQEKLVRQFVSQAISRSVGFAFGGSVTPINAPVSAEEWLEDGQSRQGKRVFARLLNDLKRTDAEVVLTGRTVPRRGKEPQKTEILIQAAERPGRPAAPPRRLTLTGAPTSWLEAEGDALAYILAKVLQPALGNPADFRVERLRPIVERLEVLSVSPLALDDATKSELADDFAVGALRIGEGMDQAAWLEKAALARTRMLATTERSENLTRWVAAKVDLGRATALLCETRFDPVKMQEAIAHLKEGVEALRVTEPLQLAEGASRALQRAERTLADRRRFSIRWPV
jgi:hypothetical protein